MHAFGCQLLIVNALLMRFDNRWAKQVLLPACYLPDYRPTYGRFFMPMTKRNDAITILRLLMIGGFAQIIIYLV